MKETVLNVKGMMCSGCENRVKNAIKNLEGVEKAEADYKTGKVVITANDAINPEQFKEIIEDIGYEVVK